MMVGDTIRVSAAAKAHSLHIARVRRSTDDDVHLAIESLVHGAGLDPSARDTTR